MFDEYSVGIGNGANLQDYAPDGWETFGKAFEDALATNPMTALTRQSQLMNYRNVSPETPRLSVEEQQFAIDAAGLTGQLQPEEEPQSWAATELLIQWKQEEIARRTALAQSDSPVISFTGGLVGSILDPINIAASFIPVVREERWAAALARANTSAGRAATRARLGATEGAVGATLIEPIPLLLLQEQQADYTALDSFMNVVFGSVMGGGLHPLFGGIGDRVNGPSLAELKMREEMFKADLAHVIDDKHPVSPNPVVREAIAETDEVKLLTWDGTHKLPHMREQVLEELQAEGVTNADLAVMQRENDPEAARALAEYPEQVAALNERAVEVQSRLDTVEPLVNRMRAAERELELEPTGDNATAKSIQRRKSKAQSEYTKAQNSLNKLGIRSEEDVQVLRQEMMSLERRSRELGESEIQMQARSEAAFDQALATARQRRAAASQTSELVPSRTETLPEVAEAARGPENSRLANVDEAEKRSAELEPEINRILDDPEIDRIAAEQDAEFEAMLKRMMLDEDAVAAIRERRAERQAEAQEAVNESEVFANALSLEVECRIG